MGELRLFEPIQDYASYIYQNGKTYVSTLEASKILEMKFNSFEVMMSNCRTGKKIKNKEWVSDILNSRVEYNGSFWYCKTTLNAYKRYLWEQEDFIYRILNAIDEIIDGGIMSESEFCKLCGLTQKKFYCYRALRAKPTFETALKIYKKLKEKHNDLR